MIGRTRIALKQPQEPMEISDLDDLVDQVYGMYFSMPIQVWVSVQLVHFT